MVESTGDYVDRAAMKVCSCVKAVSEVSLKGVE